MKTDENYVKDLEDTISKFMSPLKDIPYSVVIKILSGFTIIPFNREDVLDKNLKKLTIGIKNAMNAAYLQGISTNRPNEVGNHIEPFVRQALNALGLVASIPKTRKGKFQSAGYPDIEIRERDGRVTYLECKTYNLNSRESSFRAFYLQPSESIKITSNARHLLVGFEIEVSKRKDRVVYVPVGWELYTLEKLRVQVKHEFNANNLQIYLQDSILAKGVMSDRILDSHN